MPLTPFHMGFAWPVWLMKKHRLHFICLSFGAMVPDLEVLWMMPFTQELGYARGYLHSYYGAVTIDLAITLFVAYLIVPPMGRWLKRRQKRTKGPKWHMFAGVDVTRPPRYHGWAILSALIGTLSHVTIDVFTHHFNPIFWPYRLGCEDNLMPFGRVWSSIAAMAILGSMILYLALTKWTKEE